jgi:hypothetical protein
LCDGKFKEIGSQHYDLRNLVVASFAIGQQDDPVRVSQPPVKPSDYTA